MQPRRSGAFLTEEVEEELASNNSLSERSQHSDRRSGSEGFDEEDNRRLEEIDRRLAEIKAQRARTQGSWGCASAGSDCQ
jgi:hypothetical protein